MSVASTIRQLRLEKAFLKYLMLSAPSPDLPSTFDAKGFMLKDFDFKEDVISQPDAPLKGLSFYDHIYEQIHNSSTERKVWFLQDMLGYWINIVNGHEDIYADESANNNHFIGTPASAIFGTEPGNAGSIDFNDSSVSSGAAQESLANFIGYLTEQAQFYTKIYETKVKTPGRDKTEVVAYRVEKIKVTMETSATTILATPQYQTVQNMWFLNVGNFNVFDYLDTQIKYGPPVDDDNKFVSYVYRVHSYILIYGTKYTYDLLIPKEDTNNQILNLLNAYRDNETADMSPAGAVGYFTPNYIEEASEQENLTGESPEPNGLGNFLVLPPSVTTSALVLGDKLTISGHPDLDAGIGVQISKSTLLAMAKQQREDPLNVSPSALFSRFFAEFNVISEPNLMIMEQIIYQTDPIIVSSKPPLPPNMEILPYQGIADKIMIKFSAPTGFHKDVPVLVTNDDHDRIIKTYISQGMSLDRAAREAQFFAENQKYRTMMEYAHDDFESKFEFFELSGIDYSKVGIKHADFGPGIVYESDSNSLFINKTIATNKKYYFMARSIDRHGQKSNPTAIYEFEMVRDGPQGGIIPVFKVFQQPYERVVDEKKVKKYLAIKPSDAQLKGLEDSVKVSDEGELILNDKNSSFINKRFKMRLTSKHTGRKIDLNVKFNLRNKGFIRDPKLLQEIVGNAASLIGADGEEEEI